MHISLKELFIYRQYTDGPVHNYFDRKTYTVCREAQLDNEQNAPYIRYIPLFQVDEQALQNEFIQGYMPKGAWRKFLECPFCFEEFMQRNNEWYHWWDFYKKAICDIARQWCVENHIAFVDEVP